MLKKRILFAFFVLAALLLAIPSALAAKEAMAQDLVSQCRFKATVNQDTTYLMRYNQLNKCWIGGTKGQLTVTLPGNQKSQGVMLAFRNVVPHLIVESLDGKKPVQIAEYDQPYYNDYIPFSKPAHSFRIRSADGKASIRISRMNVLSTGKLPSWVQRWQTLPDGAADIMLFVTHPDDDILWFGGLLPTYAGQKKLKVIVVYAVTGKRLDRRNELLDALWHCGVKYFPHMPTGISASNFTTYAVSCIRRYKPSVVVTQDVNGEYGHKAHLKLVKAVIQAVKTDCLKKNVSPTSARKYGLYQPQKLYVHLWKKNQSVFDWRVPLSAFGGKTGIRLAQEAFKMHVSQQNGRHQVQDSGPLDCRKMGLYWTRVGLDNTKKPDLMQHVKNEKK